MNYFGTADKHSLRVKLLHRQHDMKLIDSAVEAAEGGRATKQQLLDLYFLALASRLLRAKFNALPALTNEELSYLTGCSSGTYLGLIMTRQKMCSKDMAELMSEKLKKLERDESMQPIHQPEYPV